MIHDCLTATTHAIPELVIANIQNILGPVPQGYRIYRFVNAKKAYELTEHWPFDVNASIAARPSTYFPIRQRFLPHYFIFGWVGVYANGVWNDVRVDLKPLTPTELLAGSE